MIRIKIFRKFYIANFSLFLFIKIHHFLELLEIKFLILILIKFLNNVILTPLRVLTILFLQNTCNLILRNFPIFINIKHLKSSIQIFFLTHFIVIHSCRQKLSIVNSNRFIWIHLFKDLIHYCASSSLSSP